jgi:hypothetical protein
MLHVDYPSQLDDEVPIMRNISFERSAVSPSSQHQQQQISFSLPVDFKQQSSILDVVEQQRQLSLISKSGLFYFLGTRGGKSLWKNPHSLNQVSVFSSGINSAGTSGLESLVSRCGLNSSQSISSSGGIRTESRLDAFVGIDLLSKQFKIEVRHHHHHYLF